jgi:predicted secreted hydrolase
VKRNTSRYRSLVATAIAALGILFGTAVPHAASAATPALSIPADEGPHNTGLEWWYFTGQLTGKDAKGVVHQYGYELTFFKPEVALTFPVADTYIAHLAITDINRGTHPFEQRTVIQSDNILPGGGFDISVLGYHMDGKNGFNHMSATTADGSYSIQLNLDSPVPAALHGGNGIIPYGPIPSSFYYSFTNLVTDGTIVDHGQPIQVTGSSWFDHQWFNYLAGTTMGWDWFAIKLDNGSQVMLYFIRDWTGNIVQKVGTLVNPDGSTVNLPSSAIADKATGSWFSWRTLRTYSSGWTVTIPGGQLNVTPRVKDQEMYLPPLPTYWEGASTVSGTYNGAPITGKAYTEISPPQIFF